MRLGINIDHVATLRNARGGTHPSPIRAAKIVEKCGADLLVVHLREDRRHIREEDISSIQKKISIPLQLEIAPTNFMFDYCINNNIKKVCIVPEKREELTTEGGLDIKKNYSFLEKNLVKLTEKNVEVSLFLDPNIENIKRLNDLGLNAVEFHTGEFANANKEEEKFFLDNIEKVTNFAITRGISIRAGHGLNFQKVKKLLNISSIEELNIGHFIIGEAIFIGLENVIKEMLALINESKK